MNINAQVVNIVHNFHHAPVSVAAPIPTTLISGSKNIILSGSSNRGGIIKRKTSTIANHHKRESNHPINVEATAIGMERKSPTDSLQSSYVEAIVPRERLSKAYVRSQPSPQKHPASLKPSLPIYYAPEV